MLPKYFAVDGYNTRRAGATQYDHLSDPVDRRAMGRTVATFTRRPKPARNSRRSIVAGQRSGGCYNHHLINHQRRTRKAPIRNRYFRIGSCVTSPDEGAIPGIEDIENSGRTQAVDPTIAQRGCAAWACAGVRFPKSGRVTVLPDRLPPCSACSRQRALPRPAALEYRADRH